jgi:hypothetical protein
MSETPEGIGSRKWSLAREGALRVMHGTTEIATLTLDGEDVKHLLVTAPQLWDAANEMIKHAMVVSAAEKAQLNEHVKHLADMVAKAVGKNSYADVKQA